VRAKSPSTSGYHPPLPPKPQQLKKSPRELAVPAVAAAEKRELIRELLFVFQVTKVESGSGFLNYLVKPEPKLNLSPTYLINFSSAQKPEPKV
jgi:hypothetical protein